MTHFSAPSGPRLGNRRLLAAALLALAAMLLTTACGRQEHRSVGVDPARVTSVDMYFYDHSAAQNPTTVTRTTITDAALIKEIVHGFTDVPLDHIGDSVDRADGAETAGLRFTLDDGSTVQLTQIFISAHDVLIVWDDGSVRHTQWGVPLVDYYEKLGPSGDVDPAERPVASLD
ncbi:MAG: hypothetical protein HGA51_00235 [Demequinaceae bacterium]|nr:hypothetical protein [Demequinaceae bacterium]